MMLSRTKMKWPAVNLTENLTAKSGKFVISDNDEEEEEETLGDAEEGEMSDFGGAADKK